MLKRPIPAAVVVGSAHIPLSNGMGDRIHLEANPQWPGRPAPCFENIIVRFYDDADGMRKSLAEFQSIDLAWTGLPYDDFVELKIRMSMGMASWTSLRGMVLPL